MLLCSRKLAQKPFRRALIAICLVWANARLESLMAKPLETLKMDVTFLSTTEKMHQILLFLLSEHDNRARGEQML